MPYHVNVIVRRRGAAPDTRVLSRRLPDGYATIEAAVRAAEAALETYRGRAAFITIRVLDGFTAVYVSERAWR